MKKFGIFSKLSKEVIFKLKASNIQEAIKFFSELKKLEEKVLLDIFIVRELEKSV